GGGRIYDRDPGGSRAEQREALPGENLLARSQVLWVPVAERTPDVVGDRRQQGQPRRARQDTHHPLRQMLETKDPEWRRLLERALGRRLAQRGRRPQRRVAHLRPV